MRSKLLLTITVCLLMLLSKTAMADLLKEALSKNLPVVVDVHEKDLKKGSGTGFYMSMLDNYYLVTAKHVVFNPRGEPLGDKILVTSIGHVFDFDTKSVYDGFRKETIDLKVALTNKNIIANNEQDIVAIKVTECSPRKEGEVRMCKQMQGVTDDAKDGTSMLPILRETIKFYDDVHLADDVYVSGYPISIGIERMPQVDFSSPLLKRGVVAGKNDKNRTIILDCFIYPGNSGGPVYQINKEGDKKFSVIGIVTQYIPIVQEISYLPFQRERRETYGNSGYSVVVPMDSIVELITNSKKD